jgi:lipid-A-disaccharide synthase
MKYYLIAGEASGDLHGGNLMKSLKNIDPAADFRYWGGDCMQEQGGVLVKHYRDTAFMGILEVIRHLGSIGNNFKLCKRDLLDFKPDVLILIDYAGFNLRMAKFAKGHGIKVFYYISPKIWAWKESRIKKIKLYVDKMFVILPFEVDFYKKHRYPVDYVGNPLLDAIEDKKKHICSNEEFRQQNSLGNEPIVALLAGSRKQEINLCLPEMLEAVKDYKDIQFVIAGAPSISKEYYNKFIESYNVKMVYNQTYELLAHSKAAIVTSGTATLETALFNVPEVVIYKTSNLTYNIGIHIVDVKFFSLVNLIMDREIVKELLQKNLVRDIRAEMDKILFDDAYREKMLGDYAKLKEKMGSYGASQRTAELLVKYLKFLNHTTIEDHI